MNQSIQIIYEDYEVVPSGINKTVKVAVVPFGDRTTPYVSSESYADNFESMVYDIMQNGFVFVNNSLIPILNIKKYLFNEQTVGNQAPQREQRPQDTKGNWRKNDRKFKKRPMAIDPAFVKPIKPEEVLPVVAPAPTAEAIGPVEVPKFKMAVGITPPNSSGEKTDEFMTVGFPKPGAS